MGNANGGFVFVAAAIVSFFTGCRVAAKAGLGATPLKKIFPSFLTTLVEEEKSRLRQRK